MYRFKSLEFVFCYLGFLIGCRLEFAISKVSLTPIEIKTSKNGLT